MRKILPVALVFASMGAFVQSGLAADIPARAPPRVAPLTAPVYGFSWTGCYIGANLGYGVSPKDWDLVGGTNTGVGSHDATGVVGGGQVGCDYQTGAFVFGLEGMWDWSGMDGSHTRAGFNFDTEISWVAAITGRVGWAVDRGLFYLKGGAAWVDDDYSFGVPGLRIAANGVSNTGWTVGAGVEWSFAPAWSAKLEYNFMDFGGDSPRFCGGGGGGCGTAFNIEQNIHLVTVGVNYRFSWH
jgi:outer membrane immunogenic protein